MRILIVDDTVEFAKMLHYDLSILFSQINDHTDFDIYTNDFSNITFQYKYDMAFLDIDLTDINGIDLARQLKESGVCNMIVFVSAHQHLVFNALAVNPFYFLRKQEYKNDLKILFEMIDDTIDDYTMISLKWKGETRLVKVEDIVYVESLNHMLYVHTIKETFEDSRLLKDFLEEVKNYGFTQIHKSMIINMHYIVSYKSSVVKMAGNIELTIGRTNKASFLKAYQEFLIQ